MSQPAPDQEAIFNAAAALPAEQRRTFLDCACASHPSLRPQLESLLLAHDRAGDFLEPGPEVALNLEAPYTGPGEEKAGERIGHYKLLQKIGEGGCGVVFMAEQEEPVRRRVALKVIKLGMDTKAVVARFEAERQALARMEHPNIARVLDAGATESGRPYFVMELVRGMRITDYCDQNNLPTEQRLTLFIKVCQAIQHAHQKGIIHRDIKPSNILVTLHDGEPVPKVIDFGIAKATQGRLTEQTLFTAFEQFIGTPAYVSPEQAEMSGLDIDTRSDIYSLGVLLYELLTGRTPFENSELIDSGLDEMRRRIREKEPPRPSVRLRTLGDEDRTTVARRRGTDAPRLLFDLSGDLDWIVMRCLEKDRSRRYGTANGLAMDIERHLNNEPVAARPPSATYLFAKLFRRHRLAFAAGFAIAGALIVGFTVSTILYFRARDSLVLAQQARVEAETGRKLAQEEFARRTGLAMVMLNNLKDIGLNAAVAPNSQMLGDLIERAVEFRRQFTDQPLVLASIDETLGGVYVRTNRYREAEELLLGALRLRQQTLGEFSPENAGPLNYLGHLYSRQSRWQEALDCHKDALEILQNPANRNRPGGNRDLDIGRTLRAIGWVLAHQARLSEAEHYLRLALQLQQKDPNARAEQAATLIFIGSVLTQDGRIDQAEEVLVDALNINRSVFGPNSIQVASSLHALGVTIAVTQVRLPEAIQLYRDAFEIREKLDNPDPEGDARTRKARVPTPTLEEVLTKPGVLAEVEALLNDAQQYAMTLYGRESWEQAFFYALRAWVLVQENRFVEAERIVRECLAIRENLGPDDWSTQHAKHLLGYSLVGQGKDRHAEGLELMLFGFHGMKERRAGIPPFQKPRLGEAAQRIRKVYATLGQVTKVDEWTAIFNSLDEEEKKSLIGRPGR